MSFKDFLIEKEYLNEMATSYSDDNTSIILPEFNKRNPKILYYHKK